MWKLAQKAHRLWLNVEPYVGALNWVRTTFGAVVVAALTAFWSWGVSTIKDIHALGWGVWLVSGLLLAVLSLLAVALSLELLNKWLMRRKAAGATAELIATEPATARPVGESAPDPPRLPSAADILDEQEWRETMLSIREFIDGSGNKARKNLEAVITQAATLYSYGGEKHPKALKFFVEGAVYRGYRSEMKNVINEVNTSLNAGSLDRAQQALARFMNEYRDGQRYLGILITATSLDLASVRGYAEWLKSDEQCVREFRALASKPSLRPSSAIKAISGVVVMASEQDFSNFDLDV